MIGITIGTMLLTAANGAGQGQPIADDRPITLVVNDRRPGVELNVVGSSATAIDVRYALEVSGGAGGHVNHSVQRGRATLRPGVRLTLVTLELGGPSSDWSATLHVAPAGRASYVVVRHSND